MGVQMGYETIDPKSIPSGDGWQNGNIRAERDAMALDIKSGKAVTDGVVYTVRGAARKKATTVYHTMKRRGLDITQKVWAETTPSGRVFRWAVSPKSEY
jgi:hypothetical protein